MEDEKIIELFFARSEQALQEVEHRYGTYCQSIAMRVLSNKEDAAECMNDLYMAAWNTIPPSRPQSLKLFLGRMTRNIACDRYDRNRAQKRGTELTIILEELQDFADIQGPTIEEQAEAGELHELLSQYLYSRNREQRDMFVRRYWYGDSVAQIAKRHRCSAGKVKSALFQMRKQLKDILAQGGNL